MSDKTYPISSEPAASSSESMPDCFQKNPEARSPSGFFFLSIDLSNKFDSGKFDKRVLSV